MARSSFTRSANLPLNGADGEGCVANSDSGVKPTPPLDCLPYRRKVAQLRGHPSDHCNQCAKTDTSERPNPDAVVRALRPYPSKLTPAAASIGRSTAGPFPAPSIDGIE